MGKYFNYHKEIKKNKYRTIFIFLIFFLYISFLGVLTGLVISPTNNVEVNIFLVTSIFLVVAVIYSLFFYDQGDRTILKLSGAKEAKRDFYPYLFHTTEALALAAGLKTSPKCYIIEDEALNAFATGFTEEKSYIVVTTGLIEKLNRRELEGVISHEMSHIKNRDIKVMLLAAGIAGSIVLLTDLLWYFLRFESFNSGDDRDGNLKILLFVVLFIFILLTPIIVQLIRLTISRNREYLADASGAKLTRYPEGLASALEKIKNNNVPLKKFNRAMAHLYIAEPKKSSFISRISSTHPPIDERIHKLRCLKF